MKTLCCAVSKLTLSIFLIITALAPKASAQEYVYDWVKTFGNDKIEYNKSIKTDASGNIYILGVFEGTIDFDPGPGTYNLTSNATTGKYETFLLKLTPGGNFVWATKISGAPTDPYVMGNSLTIDDNSNIYITGFFYDAISFQGNNQTITLTATGNYVNAFIAKYDSNGYCVWGEKIAGASRGKYIYTKDNNLFLIGDFKNNCDFDPGPGVHSLFGSVVDVFILKLTTDGGFVWVKKVGGNSYDYGKAITVDNVGNIITTGTFRNTVDFDPGTGTHTLSSNGNDDIFILKLDSNGNYLWAIKTGGSYPDTSFDITTDSSDNIITTGYFNGVVDFDPGAGVYNLTAQNSYSMEVFIQKLNPSGNFIWAKQTEGTGNLNIGYTLVIDQHDNIYTAGMFSNTVDFDPGPDVFQVTSTNLQDAFIEKLDKDGNFKWVKTFGGENRDWIRSITLDYIENIITAGTFTRNCDFDTESTTDIHSPNSGTTNNFVHKLSTRSFITTWKTDNPGVSNNASIRIYTDPNYSYNYDVDWNNDGIFDQFGITGTVNHNFGTPGTYTIRIRGQFPHIYIGYNATYGNGDCKKIISVDQWGSIRWETMKGSFYSCTNLHINATDAPDLTNVTDMSFMFTSCYALNENINHWDVSHITDMSYLFFQCYNFNQPLNNWNTGNVTNMNHMFASARVFNQDLNNWDTSQVTNMATMFASADNFNQPLDNWNTGNVTSMYEMFSGADNFNQNINTWNTSQVTNMGKMFFYASNFNQPLNNWDTSQVVNMTYMFYNTPFNQPLDNWDTSQVTNMRSMFSWATSFDQNLGNWNISSLMYANNMFANVTLSTANYDALLIGWQGQPHNNNVTFSGGNSKYCHGENARNILTGPDGWTITDGGKDCSAYAEHFVTTWKTDNPGASNATSITIPTTGGGYNYDVDWDNDGIFDQFGITGNVTHDFGTAGTYTIRIRGQFPRIYFNNAGDKQKILSVDQWGTITWTSMARAFYGCSNLHINATDAPDLSMVTDMSYMFYGCISFNENINHWNVSNVTNMEATFSFTPNFNQPLDNWDTGNVIYMNGLFFRSSFNQNINSWNVSNVVNMAGMFRENSNFNQPLNNWNTGNVTNMYGMFASASSFNQSINNWDISNVTDIRWIFSYATQFNQPLNNWNTGNITDMTGMFFHAENFNQPLNNWDTGNVTDMKFLFNSAYSFNQDIGNWDTANVTYMNSMFAAAYDFNQDIGNWNTSNVISMNSMFASCHAFDQNLGNWDIHSLTNAGNMFFGVTLSMSNYDALLIGWQGQPHNNNVTFSGGNSKYCQGENARNILTGTDGWTITDEGIGCKPDCTEVNTPPNGASNVALNQILSWNAANHATGYYITIGTSSGNTDIENHTDLGNTTSYTPNTNWACDNTYFVTIHPYNAAGETIGCNETSFSTINSPPVDTLPDVTVCGSYTLPTINNGNYFTQSGGTGTQLNAGEVITSSQTLYIYASNGSCDNETSFDVTVNPVPAVDTLPDVTAYNQYELPTITNGDYYTEPMGQGTALYPGDIIEETTTIYIYAETGMQPDICFDQSSFTITIIHQFVYPLFFTPNGDGFNDSWGIYNPAMLDDSSLIHIYDRYGKLVATIHANIEKWDGMYNNKALPASDYWFTVTLKNGKEFKGHFALKR